MTIRLSPWLHLELTLTQWLGIYLWGIFFLIKSFELADSFLLLISTVGRPTSLIWVTPYKGHGRWKLHCAWLLSPHCQVRSFAGSWILLLQHSGMYWRPAEDIQPHGLNSYWVLGCWNCELESAGQNASSTCKIQPTLGSGCQCHRHKEGDGELRNSSCETTQIDWTGSDVISAVLQAQCGDWVFRMTVRSDGRLKQKMGAVVLAALPWNVTPWCLGRSDHG